MVELSLHLLWQTNAVTLLSLYLPTAEQGAQAALDVVEQARAEAAEVLLRR